MGTERRSALKKLLLSAVGVTGLSIFGSAVEAAPLKEEAPEKVAGNVTTLDDIPLFSGHTKLGNMVFIAGAGAHIAPFTIEAHTEIVLKALEAELIKAGSSMEKVLKVTVFLNDIADYKGMNSIYKGRFGSKPPVRTTIAVAKGGVPGDSLVEMDCIAYI